MLARVHCHNQKYIQLLIELPLARQASSLAEPLPGTGVKHGIVALRRLHLRMEIQMPKYLVEASYLSEGVSGLLKEGGSGRRRAIDELFKSLGGTVEAFYFAFGDEDVFIIGDLPDNVSAAALILRVNATGAARCKTIVLLTAQEVDEAVKKSSVYRPPGYEEQAEVAKWEGEGGHLAQGATKQ